MHHLGQGGKSSPLLPPTHPSHTQLYVVSEVLKYDASGKATVSVVTANVSYAQTCSSPGGTYLFANLEIATTPATGKTRFRLVTSGNQGEWVCKGEGRGDAIQMEVFVPRSITWRVQDQGLGDEAIAGRGHFLPPAFLPPPPPLLL